MGISIFLSRATPHEEGQQAFLKQAIDYLCDRGLSPRTIGDTDYGREPMPHIRSVMMDCNGLLGIAFRRFHVLEGEDRPDISPHLLSDDPTIAARQRMGRISDRWLTTSYLHLEAAIAYSLGLPILLIVEKGVMEDGALESGVLQMYPQVFSTASAEDRELFFVSEKWRQLINSWEGEVREVSRNKGRPPRLYGV